MMISFLLSFLILVFIYRKEISVNHNFIFKLLVTLSKVSDCTYQIKTSQKSQDLSHALPAEIGMDSSFIIPAIRMEIS